MVIPVVVNDEGHCSSEWKSSKFCENIVQ